MHLEERIFSIQSDQDFNDTALEVFDYQYMNVPVYKEYVDQLGYRKPKLIEDIPFLPISFFKSHKVSVDADQELLFKSSGTGGIRSQHFVKQAALYERSFNSAYDHLIGDPKNHVILALLPNYLEQGDSSLVYMIDHLIKRTGEKLSGFVLGDFRDLANRYEQAIQLNKEVIIFGVSYALLDLAEERMNLSKAMIIETGGMKGKRTELTKSELHNELRTGLNCQNIWSEYGMTEMLSQAYSREDEIFKCAKTMRILIREMNDPFRYSDQGKTGGINIIDLSNLYSCSFIETQDLGQLIGGGFKVMGRFDQADLRGCNLLINE